MNFGKHSKFYRHMCTNMHVYSNITERKLVHMQKYKFSFPET